jgi:hypothetical protein
LAIAWHTGELRSLAPRWRGVGYVVQEAA